MMNLNSVLFSNLYQINCSEGMVKNQQSANKIIQQLPQLNKNSRYQYLMIIIILLIWLVRSFVTVLCSFVFMNPIFQCNGQRTSQKQACEKINECTITNDYTATYHAELYCQNQSLRQLFQSVQFIGAIFSMIVISPLGDKNGRRHTILLLLVLGCVGISTLIFGIYRKLWVVITVGQFLNGASTNGLGNLTLIYASEFLSKKGCRAFINCCWIIWCIGFMLFMPVYQFIPQWYKFTIYLIAVPTFILLALCYFFLSETPHFCLLMDRDQYNFNKCIDKIAYYNSSDQQVVKKIKDEANIFFLQNPQQEEKECLSIPIKSQVQKVLHSGLMNPFLITSFLKMGTNLFYYTLLFCVERIGQNFGMSMLIMGANDCIAAILAYLFTQRKTSKKQILTIIIFAFIVGLIFALDSVKNNQTIKIILATLCSICTIIIFRQVSIITVQIFPPQIKSSVMGFGDVISQIGKISSPYVITLANNINIYPQVVSSCLFFIFGVVPMLFLKYQEKEGKKDEQQNQKTKLQQTHILQSKINARNSRQTH